MNGMYGELAILAERRDGTRYAYATPNTLTFEAARIASHMLVGDVPNDYKVNTLGVGTGITTPTRSDTSLETLIHQLPVDVITFPDAGQVEFKTVLEFISPANGSLLTEAGLYANDGTTLFSRQVHTGVAKDDNFRVEYIWRIVFT